MGLPGFRHREDKSTAAEWDEYLATCKAIYYEVIGNQDASASELRHAAGSYVGMLEASLEDLTDSKWHEFFGTLKRWRREHRIWKQVGPHDHYGNPSGRHPRPFLR